MSRYTRKIPGAGQASWDAEINDNFQNIFDRPLPIALHAGDESDLETTFPAASYDRCLIWVNHTVDGWKIYFSNGTVWAALTTGGGGGSSTLVRETISGAGAIAATTNYATCTGTTYTVTLPPAATAGAGWVLFVKRTSSGDIIVAGDGSETIDGNATFTLRSTLQAIELVSDGSNWSIAASYRSRAAPLTAELIPGAGAIAAATDIAICSGTTYTVDLPPAATYGVGRVLIVKRTSSGNITLDGDSSETIDGAATFVMDVALMSVSLYSDGSNWHLI